ncbi:MAG: tripartite tricarboxylate transporter TctB family protein [Actinobacteria bacterium]|jgi:putative tricarboxylic transport membrane protein|nr:tripartite tricarboxylate transporter TctB family protein [Actinomycetota bacterium]
MKFKAGAKSELTFVGSLFALGVLVFWDTWRTELPEINLTISPKLFPYIVSVLLMILSAILFIQVLRGDLALPEGLEPGDKIEKSDLRTFLVVLASLFAYLLLIERAGFVIANTVTFIGISYSFGNKNLMKAAGIAVLISTIIYFSFTKFLHVALPSGIFKGLM